MRRQLMFVLAIAVTAAALNTAEHEAALLQNTILRPTYSKFIRPVENGWKTIDITMDIAIRQILELNLKEQFIKMQTWLRFSWNDALLRWNPSDYGAITSIHVPAESIWTPDITIYNSLNELDNPVNMLHTGQAVVQHNGDVQLNSPLILGASCDIDIELFPFDTQSCIIEFGSWTFTGDFLDMFNKTPEADTGYFIPHSELILKSAYAERVVAYYGSTPPVPYVSIKYHIVLCRMPLHYSMSFILPCILLSSLSTTVFLLPTESGEKMGFSLTLILGMTVFQLIFVENMPATSLTVPLLSVYFSCSLIIMIAGTAFTGFVLTLHHRSERGYQVPAWMRRVAFDRLAPCLLMSKEVQRLRVAGSAEPDDDDEGCCMPNRNKVEVLDVKASVKNGIQRQPTRQPIKSARITSPPSQGNPNALTERVSAIETTIREQRDEIKLGELAKAEWVCVAAIADRLCFACFTVVNLILIIWIMSVNN